NTVLQKDSASSSTSFSTISEAAIQENYDELSSSNDNENNCSSDSNYEED
ncbi:23178_t:CDS:1, partial [Racocetra persica]